MEKKEVDRREAIAWNGKKCHDIGEVRSIKSAIEAKLYEVDRAENPVQQDCATRQNIQ